MYNNYNIKGKKWIGSPDIKRSRLILLLLLCLNLCAKQADAAALTETVLADTACFAQTEYPLIAACPEYDVLLYALDKEPRGRHVLLRSGGIAQELYREWRAVGSALPQLAADVYHAEAPADGVLLYGSYPKAPPMRYIIYFILRPGAGIYG